MKYAVLLGLLIYGLTASAGERVLLVLGDSLSAGFGIDVRDGWVSLLQGRLANRGWRVVNGAVSGDTTAGGLARLPQLLERERPALVVIALGSNDGLRGLAFEEIRGNLRRMIRLVGDQGGRVLLAGARLPLNYGRAYREAFERVFQEVAETEQVPLVPFLLEGVALDPQLMQADGYHPNVKAQPMLLENVWPLLQEELDEIGQGTGS
jgi:acyl-CoA thioesterase-1